VAAGATASWYGLPLTYQPEELGGLPVDHFHRAPLAEGCREVDRPGSTCPLNLLPLFDTPTSLLPGYPGDLHYRPGDFPRAEALHAATLKHPVWHAPDDDPLVDALPAHLPEGDRPPRGVATRDRRDHRPPVERLGRRGAEDGVAQLVVGADIVDDGRVLCCAVRSRTS
jgi:hypothetical protein